MYETACLLAWLSPNPPAPHTHLYTLCVQLVYCIVRTMDEACHGNNSTLNRLKWAADCCALKHLLQLCAQILQHQQISHPKIEPRLLLQMLTQNQESEMSQRTILQKSDSDGKVTHYNNNIKKKNPGTVYFPLGCLSRGVFLILGVNVCPQ